MKQNIRRSSEPIFWGLFGAGGMWGAIFAPAVILVMLLFPAFGIDAGVRFLVWAYGSFFGRLFTLCMIVLPLWCGMHRIHHTLHDLKIHSPLVKYACYGVALGLTALAFWYLLTR